MDIDRKGVSLSIEKIDNRNFFLTLKAVGKITHEDYNNIIPMIEGAIKGVRDPKIRALINLNEFDGWADLQAVWDDMKFGLDHKHDFKKIAVICDGKWQEMMVKVVSWFMDGEIQKFDSLKSALDWLKD